MSDTPIWYSSGSDDRYELPPPIQWWDSTNEPSLKSLASSCADDFHSNHDGWECSWPRDFVLYDSEEGPPLATFEVEREAMPMFYPTRKS